MLLLESTLTLTRQASQVYSDGCRAGAGSLRFRLGQRHSLTQKSAGRGREARSADIRIECSADACLCDLFGREL